MPGYRTPDRLQARIALHERFGPKSEDLHRFQFDHVLRALAAGQGEVHQADAAASQRRAVLDVGVGTGRLWQANAERVPASWDLTLSDASAGMVAEAGRMLNRTGLPGRAIEADASELPFADASFDLVFANHMLYHVPDIERAVSELRRVLKRDGLLYAATNGAQHLALLRVPMRELADLAPELTVDGTLPLRFELESGGDLLRTAFAHVERVDRFDELIVTAVEPLMAYLWSVVHLPEPVEPDLEERVRRWDVATRERFEKALETGPVRVGRAAGFFVAHGTPNEPNP
ncbi:MAG: class I SAM-dependent methyltransferase [Trueperaceae bacterium]